MSFGSPGDPCGVKGQEEDEIGQESGRGFHGALQCFGVPYLGSSLFLPGETLPDSKKFRNQIAVKFDICQN